MAKVRATLECDVNAGRITTLDIHIRGVVPCIMSNGAMADPTYYWAKVAREIRKGVPKGQLMTEQQADQYYHALFMGQLYLLDDNQTRTPYWPSENVEGMIRRGAKKTKKGKVAQVAFTVDGDFPLIYDGPDIGEELWATGDHLTGGFQFKNRVPGAPGKGTTINCRCRFPAWEFKFRMLLDTTQADVSDVRRWLIDAAELVGLSAWTPKYGRFELVSLDVL